MVDSHDRSSRPAACGHLTDDEIDAIAAGGSEGSATSAVGRHLEGCERCARRVAEMQTMLELLDETPRLQAAPKWFRQRALEGIRRRRERGSRWQGFLRCVHDSLLAPAPVGARGPAGPGRHLLLAGEGVELDLHLVPGAEEAPGSLTGQVLRHDQAGCEELARLGIELEDDRGTRTETHTDRFGIFSLPGDWQPPLLVVVHIDNRSHEAFIPAGEI